MIRGGINGEHATAKFIDIEDIVPLIRAILSGHTSMSYRKTVKHPASI